MVDRKILVLAVLTALLAPRAAFAYGGPGGVITGLGALIAVATGIVAAILGFFWYPLKRLIRRMRGTGRNAESDPSGR